MPWKILVIDDDPDILNVLQIILEAHAYEVTTSTNANAIWEIIEKFKPDAILLDIMLGPDDGKMICADIKFNEKTKHLPVVLLSASTQNKADILKWGADDFISKPFEIDHLLNTLKSYPK